MNLRTLALAAVSAIAVTGCAATARFVSKNGQFHHRSTERAVITEESEISAVLQAGGEAIGTISAKGLTVISTDEDVALKAAKIAAKSGGTHIVLTAKGVETFTVTTYGQKKKECVRGDDSVECTTTYIPPTSNTYEKPTAKFVVFLVPWDRWGQLPPALRPRPIN